MKLCLTFLAMTTPLTEGFSNSLQGKARSPTVLYANDYLDSLDAYTEYQQEQRELVPTKEVVAALEAQAAKTAVAPPQPVAAQPQPTNVEAPKPVEPVVAEPPATTAATETAPALNGWIANSEEPLYGLPGAIEPLGYFDPAGFASDVTLSTAKRIRESEVLHGRVAMVAIVGFLAGDAVQSGPLGVTGPAIHQLDQVPANVLYTLSAVVAIAEINRARIGWVFPNFFVSKSLWSLKETYYPGDIGFDPLGLKPKDEAEFETMAAKELSNGRLAMIAVAIVFVQELLTEQTVLDFWKGILN